MPITQRSTDSVSVVNSANTVIETVSARTVMTKRFFCRLAFREAILPEMPNSRPESVCILTFSTVFLRVMIASIGVLRITRIPTPYAERNTQTMPTAAATSSIRQSTENGRFSFASVIPRKSSASPAFSSA